MQALEDFAFGGKVEKLLFAILFQLFGVVEHGRAEAVFPAFADEDVVVGATAAAVPELHVVGEFGIGDRLVAQVGVDFHHGQAGGQAEDFGVGILLAGQLENPLFDGFCHAGFAESGRDDKAGISDVLAVAPRLDVAKAYPLAPFGMGNDGLVFQHFLLDEFRRPFGDAGAAGFGGGFHFGANGICEVKVLLGGNG